MAQSTASDTAQGVQGEVRLLIDGRTNRQVAEELVLSPKTVANHVDSLMRKLGVSSRTALAVRAVEDGIV